MNFKLKIKKDFEHIKKNYKVIILLILTLYFYNVLTNLVYYLHKRDEHLKDLLFDIFPHKNIGIISDILTMFYFSYCVLFIFLPYIIDVKFSSSEIFLVISKTFIISSFLRSISFIFTILPSPAEHCQINSDNYNPPNILQIFIRMDMFKGCGDLIFSGHTNIITIVSLTTLYYLYQILKKSFFYLYVLFVFIFQLTLFILIIISRNHYTVDIIISIYVTILVFYMVINNFKLSLSEENKKNERVILKDCHIVNFDYL